MPPDMTSDCEWNLGARGRGGKTAVNKMYNDFNLFYLMVKLRS
jgi:hypothetical protein